MLFVFRLLTGLAVVLSGMAALSWFYQDEVALSVINPNKSYEAYGPPPAPDYATANDAWLARGAGEGPADVFFIHNNVYRGDGNWNAPYNRDTQLPFLRDVLLPLEAGPFAQQGRLWAPRYRQATLAARFTQKHPGYAARETAYDDVLSAFDLFLRERDPNKPFIVAGYGDGALYAGQIWNDRIDTNPVLKNRLAVLYAIGLPLPERMFFDDVCQGFDEARCILGFAPVDSRFETYQERLRGTTLTLALGDRDYTSTSDGTELCAPPPLPRNLTAVHIGDEGQERIGFTLNARCDRGLLLVDPPSHSKLRTERFYGRQWMASRSNLFYEPLADDAEARVIGALRMLAKEANTVPPMMEAEEIRPSDINKVPE
ncbi:MAG: DUF3089 domain-containing protein [Pseudomonadota bacterium]